MWLEDTWTTGIMTAKWALTLVRLKDRSTRSAPGGNIALPSREAKLVAEPSLPVSEPWEGIPEPRHPPWWSLGAPWGTGSPGLWVAMGMGWPTKKNSRGLGRSLRQNDGKSGAFTSPFSKMLAGWQVQSVTQGARWHPAPSRSSLWARPSCSPPQDFVCLK